MALWEEAGWSQCEGPSGDLWSLLGIESLLESSSPALGWAGLGRVDRQLPFPLQYPVRPASMTYDDIPHLSAKIKPKQQKVGCPLMEVEEGRGAMGAG